MLNSCLLPEFVSGAAVVVVVVVSKELLGRVGRWENGLVFRSLIIEIGLSVSNDRNGSFGL